MKWFYFESDRGCGIREYRNHESALKGIAREVGEGYVTVVREATEKDISWVRVMGGFIPERHLTKRQADGAGTRCPKCKHLPDEKYCYCPCHNLYANR